MGWREGAVSCALAALLSVPLKNREGEAVGKIIRRLQINQFLLEHCGRPEQMYSGSHQSVYVCDAKNIELFAYLYGYSHRQKLDTMLDIF